MPLSNAERQRRFKARRRQKMAEVTIEGNGNDLANDGNVISDSTVEPYLTRHQRKSREWHQARAGTRKGLTLARVPLKTGGPSNFTPELGNLIIQSMLHHGSMRRACELDPNIPGRSTIRLWTITQPEFRAAYARAREAVVDDWVEEMIEIADDEGSDPLSRRVRVDARRWIMSKLAPGRFGDKLTLAASDGAAGFANATALPEMSDAELDALERLAQVRLAELGQIEGEAEAVEEPTGVVPTERSTED